MVPEHIDVQIHTVIHTIGNWEIYQDDSYEDGEGFVKPGYFAHHVPTGNFFDVDHSPYEEPSRAACQAYIIMGFPERRNGSPWKNAKIIDAHFEVTDV